MAEIMHRRSYVNGAILIYPAFRENFPRTLYRNGIIQSERSSREIEVLSVDLLNIMFPRIFCPIQ